jgi:hypothetical protein
MLEPGIKSRPVYGTLSPQPGLAHVFVVDARGAEAVVDMAAHCPPGFFSKATIFHVAREDEEVCPHALRGLGAPTLVTGATWAEIEPRLFGVLANAHMGTKVYTAGTESLMGQTTSLAQRCGFELGAIVTEHRGSAARRVQCVHCKAFTENVTTQPATCAGCGLALLVRDHYSHRLAAFQGVCIDAEVPGTAPPAEEVFR